MPRPPYPRDRYPNRAPDPNRDRVPDRRPSYRGDRYADRAAFDPTSARRQGRDPLALPPPDALDQDEELVAGRRPVEEAFVARRPARRLLVVPQRRAALEKLVLHATSLRIPIVEVEGGSLTALAGFDGHQGIALVVEPRQFAGLDDILARANERGEPPFILVLDSLEDPHNVGTLLRSAEARRRPRRDLPDPSPGAAQRRPRSRPRPGPSSTCCSYPADDLPGDADATSTAAACGSSVPTVEAPLTARQTDLRGPAGDRRRERGAGPGCRRSADGPTRSCASR